MTPPHPSLSFSHSLSRSPSLSRPRRAMTAKSANKQASKQPTEQVNSTYSVRRFDSAWSERDGASRGEQVAAISLETRTPVPDAARMVPNVFTSATTGDAIRGCEIYPRVYLRRPEIPSLATGTRKPLRSRRLPLPFLSLSTTPEVARRDSARERATRRDRLRKRERGGNGDGRAKGKGENTWRERRFRTRGAPTGRSSSSTSPSSSSSADDSRRPLQFVQVSKTRISRYRENTPVSIERLRRSLRRRHRRRRRRCATSSRRDASERERESTRERARARARSLSR